MIGYLTAEDTLKANGAWYVVDADTNNTDCAASAVGPRLDRAWPLTNCRNGSARNLQARSDWASPYQRGHSGA